MPVCLDREPTRPGRVRRRGHSRHPTGHDVRAVPLGRGEVGQPADQPRPRPDQPDARIQGLRRPDRTQVDRATMTEYSHPQNFDRRSVINRPSSAPDPDPDPLDDRRDLAIVGNGMAASRLLDDLIRRGGMDRYRIVSPADGRWSRVLRCCGLFRGTAGDAADDRRCAEGMGTGGHSRL